MCPAKSALRVQHELHMELICKHSHQPPALDGQNGPPPARLLCWIPFEAQSRSDLLWAAPRWTHVDSPWILWVPAEVHPCLQIGPIEKTKIDLALKTVNIKSGFFKHKTAKTNDQIRDFGVVMKLFSIMKKKHEHARVRKLGKYFRANGIWLHVGIWLVFLLST